MKTPVQEPMPLAFRYGQLCGVLKNIRLDLDSSQTEWLRENVTRHLLRAEEIMAEEDKERADYIAALDLSIKENFAKLDEP